MAIPLLEIMVDEMVPVVRFPAFKLLTFAPLMMGALLLKSIVLPDVTVKLPFNVLFCDNRSVSYHPPTITHVLSLALTVIVLPGNNDIVDRVGGTKTFTEPLAVIVMVGLASEFAI